MLQRTLSRTEGGGPRISWRPVLLVAAVMGAGAGLYWLLPEPGPRIRPSALSEEELTAKILELRLPEPPAPTRVEKKRAAFGAKLFVDRGLSHDGQTSCASCHMPDKSFTDGGQARTLINAGQHVWLQADGRADSLAAAALLPLEDPAMFGTSRVAVVRHVTTKFADDYEDAFDGLPSALKKATLPPAGMPQVAPPKVPIALSAYALATLGSFPLMTDVLKAAQAARLAPAMELTRRALATAPTDQTWHEQWAQLEPEIQDAVNRVYANVGKALAAYLEGLTANESPFDRFAARLAQGKTLKDALDTGFGAEELAGLGLFLGPAGCGNCHAGPAFTDQRFHNLGLAQRNDRIEFGRAVAVLERDGDPFTCFGTLLKPEDAGAWPVTCERPAWAEADLTALVGAFKTPTLRNVTETAPYMHDGRFASLDDVLTYYSELSDKPAIGRRAEGLEPLDLTHEERQALLAFLGALASPVRDARTGQTVSVKP